VAFLPAKAPDFTHSHSFDPERGQRLAHLLELEGFDYGLEFFHHAAFTR
jgi:hypothetical protein